MIKMYHTHICIHARTAHMDPPDYDFSQCAREITASSRRLSRAPGAHDYLKANVFPCPPAEENHLVVPRHARHNVPLYSGKRAIEFGSRVDELISAAAGEANGLEDLAKTETGHKRTTKTCMEQDAVYTAAAVCKKLTDWGFVSYCAQLEVRLPDNVTGSTVCGPVLDLLGSKGGKLVVVELKCGHRVSSVGKIHNSCPTMRGEFRDIKDSRKNRACAQLALQRLAVEMHVPAQVEVIGVVLFVKPLGEPRLCTLPLSIYNAARRLTGYPCTEIDPPEKASAKKRKTTKGLRQATLHPYLQK